jgi:hypothetical protein
MNDNILRMLESMRSMKSTSARVIVLDQIFTCKILAHHHRQFEEVTFIDYCGMQGRAVPHADSNVAFGIRGWYMKVANAFWKNIRVVTGWQEMDRTRVLVRELNVIMPHVELISAGGKSTTIDLHSNCVRLIWDSQPR